MNLINVVADTEVPSIRIENHVISKFSPTIYVVLATATYAAAVEHSNTNRPIYLCLCPALST